MLITLLVLKQPVQGLFKVEILTKLMIKTMFRSNLPWERKSRCRRLRTSFFGNKVWDVTIIFNFP